MEGPDASRVTAEAIFSRRRRNYSINPSSIYVVHQASFKRASRAWSSPALPKPTSDLKSFADMESQPDGRQRFENDRKFDSAITLRCKLLKTQGKFRGWEAGIRTPITWSRGAGSGVGDVGPRRFV
jgi:hypothetical protein